MQTHEGKHTNRDHQDMIMRWQQMLFLCAFIVAAASVQQTHGFECSRIRNVGKHHSIMLETTNADILSVSEVPIQSTSVRPRRRFIKESTAFLFSWSCWSSSRQPAQASDVRGPVELLRPATRVRLYIDQAVDLCMEIQKINNPSPSSLDPLSALFDHEPSSFLNREETKLSKRYLEIDTSTGWQAARLREREARGAEIGIDYTTPYDKLNTAFQQWGDRTQFRILRSRQRKLEKSDSLRAALNAYTNNLVFGDAYQLNVQGEEKRNLVRNNFLPDVNAVVVSDLDLRDLYRNQILENMDNAKAELGFQRKLVEVEAGEILVYLVAAQAATNEWFGFIPKDDVKQALEAVMAEERGQGFDLNAPSVMDLDAL